MFSKSTEYALRATIFIAIKSSEENKVSIQEIAEGIDAPKAFVAKVLQQLTKKEKSIIVSMPGRSGGFYITEEQKKKSIYSVIEAMDETNVITDCVLGLPHCSDEHPCSMHKTYKGIKIELLNMFKQRSINDIVNSKDRLIPINLTYPK